MFDRLADAAATGPRVYDPAWGVRLAELTGLPLADAHLLAAGLPQLNSYENNFLPKDLRTRMGLKVAEAAQARDRLRAKAELWAPMLALAVPVDDPGRLVSDGPDVEAMAAFWSAHVPAGPELPPELWDNKPDRVSASLAAELLTGTSLEFLDTDPGWQHSVVPVVLWLTWALPADAPVRDRLAEALERVRTAVRTLPRQYSLGSDYQGRGRALLGIPARVEGGTGSIHAVRALRVDATQQRFDQFLIVPAELTGPDDPDIALTATLCELLGSGHGMLWLVEDRFAAFVDAVRPVPRPGSVFDPRVAVPDLVDEVATAIEVSADAAAYYLQLLALAQPTDRAVQDWNGWTRKWRVAAGAELLARDLVVEAKRPRAGRSLFLPGGWLRMDSPNLPIETWKRSWYPIVVQDSGKGYARYSGTPALLPPQELFTVAWHRSRGDNGPGFGDLQTTRRGLQ